MKRHALILTGLVLLLAAMVFSLPDGETRLFRGTVSDRAMDDGLPYIGILCEDGSGVCVYFRKAGLLPEEVIIGTQVEALCRVAPLEHGIRYYVNEIAILE